MRLNGVVYVLSWDDSCAALWEALPVRRLASCHPVEYAKRYDMPIKHAMSHGWRHCHQKVTQTFSFLALLWVRTKTITMDVLYLSVHGHCRARFDMAHRAGLGWIGP